MKSWYSMQLVIHTAYINYRLFWDRWGNDYCKQIKNSSHKAVGKHRIAGAPSAPYDLVHYTRII